MWKLVESNNPPLEVDTESDSSVVYVTRNVTEVERKISEDSEETITSYVYECNEIPKKDWELYKKLLNHDSDIADVQDALIELAELIEGA